MEDIEKFIEYLRMYLAGDCDLGDVRPYFEKLDKFHDFDHYLSDADIREKDEEYAKMQNNELKKFIAAIERNDFETAKQITFLGNS